MCSWHSIPCIVVTHIPSNEMVKVDLTSINRSQHKAKNVAMKILKSRLWAFENGFERPDIEEFKTIVEE